MGPAAASTVPRSGRPLVAEAVLAIAIGWSAVGLLTLVLLLLARLVRWIPARLLAPGVAGVLAVGVALAMPVNPGGLAVAGVFLLAGGLVGAAIASLQPPRVAGRRLVVVSLCLAIGVLGLVATPLWLAWPGPDPDDEMLTATGPYAVSTLTYGAGDHRHRAVFGERVGVVTENVDGTALLERWSGWRGALRTRYWGFGPDRLPLNATVWLPERDDPGPLVLIVHCNHPMEVASDEGYGWLAEDLASHGYVVASVDQNSLNLSLTRGSDLGAENDARAWLLLEHLRLWARWQRDPGSPLQGTTDLARIALIGHSRGGEAVAHAAQFDQMDRCPEDATVRDDRSNLEVLWSPDDPAWTRTSRLLTRYADSTQVLIAGFGEDVDPTTGTLPGAVLEGRDLAVWREERVALRWVSHDANAVVLGWQADSGRSPTYTVHLPDSSEVEVAVSLMLDIGDARDTVEAMTATPGPVGVVAELVDIAGRTERIDLPGGVPPAVEPRRLKRPLPDPVRGPEGMSQTFHLEVPATLAPLAEIRLRFDGTTSGAVRVERIALGR